MHGDIVFIFRAPTVLCRFTEQLFHFRYQQSPRPITGICHEKGQKNSDGKANHCNGNGIVSYFSDAQQNLFHAERCDEGPLIYPGSGITEDHIGLIGKIHDKGAAVLLPDILKNHLTQFLALRFRE